MDRLFLDANVLFSAAYREEAGLLRLWEVDGVEMITSRYAVEEARRNLQLVDQRVRLDALLEATEIVDETPDTARESDERLPEKDRPILHAAVRARATHLLTGDVTHFGRFFGTLLHGVMILAPGDYLRSRRHP